MKQFSYYAPTDLEGVLKILAHGEDTYFIAGGTDIMIQMRKKWVQPRKLIDLKKVSEINYIQEDGDVIRVGATTTFTQLERSDLIKRYAKVLAKSAAEVGSPQIRNLGTVGGNIANSSAAADSVTALMALDAKLKLVSLSGERVVELKEFYIGNGNTNLKPDEVITEVFFNKLEYSEFKKLGRRKALAIVVLSVGAAFELNMNENKFSNVKISLGAVARHPMRAYDAEQVLEGQEISFLKLEECIEKISEIAEASVRNSPFKLLAPYKKESIKGVARQVLENLYNEQVKASKGV